MSIPAIGTRAVCGRCGRTVWLRQYGTLGYGDPQRPGAPIFQWVSRKSPRPTRERAACVPDPGYQTGYHRPLGAQSVYYGTPDPITT